MTPPLSPERLTRLLDDAVRPVTARPDALDRIRQGTRRRRRTAHRAGVVLLTAAVLAVGTVIALLMAPAGGPARITGLGPSAAQYRASSSANSQAQAGPPAAGQTRTTAQPTAAFAPGPSAAHPALPSTGLSVVPSAAQSPAPSHGAPAAPSAAQSAASSAGVSAAPSTAVSAPPSATQSAAPSATPSAAPSAAVSAGPSPSSPPSATPSAPPSANRPAAAAIPSVTDSAAWAIDGPGKPTATVSIVAVGNAKTTFRFQLVIRSAVHGTQTLPFSATSTTGMPPLGPVVVGAANAAKDGHTELFVLVDAGCCTEFWTVFRLVNGHVVQVRLAGAPVRLAVGGSVTDNGGFSCSGPNLVTYTYAHQASTGTRESFLATRDTYRWVGDTLLLVSQRQTTILGAQNPELAQYSGVSCGALPQYVLKR